MAVKKGLLIFPILNDLNAFDGIMVKNEGIRKGFVRNGMDVDVLEFTTRGVFLKGVPIFKFASSRYLRIYQFLFTAWRPIARAVASGGYDFIWFRIALHHIFSGASARFLKSVRAALPAAKIVLEYGAYPFDDELTKPQRVLYRLRRHTEKAMHVHADFVVTYSGQERVDNLVNIPINNGIELDDIPVNPDLVNPLAAGIRFISVSSLKKWHAVERFLEGMAIYIAQPGAAAIHFDIVGNGPEYDKLAAVVAARNLQQHVSFHFFKRDKELDAVYQQCQVAIGTFGFHRIGITNSSSLKNREYFARGLPVVLSTLDLDMPPECPYVQYVPEGEEPIDIASVVEFSRRVYEQPDLHKAIRSYAGSTISWQSKVCTVLAYVNHH
jgi:hypothetical protein